MTLIDVHTHLHMLDQPPAEAVQTAVSAGVTRMITIGTNPTDHPWVLRDIDLYAPHVFGALGIHPHEAEIFDDSVEQALRKGLDHPRIIAAGEMGLDYYYDNAPRETQKSVFRRQLAIAEEKKLPVEIHTRDAEADTITILKEFSGRVKGLLHCFSGTRSLAEEALALGFDISLSGIVTFKKAEELREVVKMVPLDRFHVETDAPFLAPIPHRGKKNVPSFVQHTAEQVAALKGLTLEELSKRTLENAKRLFSKLA
jgi:TatD DNase family protein